MLQSLRQISMLVPDLQQAANMYKDLLGMEPVFEDRSSQYPVDIKILPAGNGTFIELMQPISDEGPIARHLDNRGASPYLLTFQTRCYDQLISNLKSLDIQITEENQALQTRHAFLHPKATNRSFIRIVEILDPALDWLPEVNSLKANTVFPRTCQLRQVAILVNDLDQAIEKWELMFGIIPTKRFQISFTDLEIAVLPLGDNNTFIELAQPTSVDSSPARFLQRYGEGIYLTIFEIEDSLQLDEHLADQNIRYTTSRRTDNYVNLGFNSIWIHPSSMGGAFVQLSQVLDPVNPWPPAGDDWFQ